MSRLRFWSTFTAPNSRSRLRISTDFAAADVDIWFMGSAFHRTGGDAADEEFTGEEVDDQRHEAGQQRRGHVDVVFLHALDRVDDVVELDGHRILLGSRVDDAEEEVVPDAG